MFVMTVDQVGSRSHPDAVRSAAETLRTTFGKHLTRMPTRTAGDEFQLAVEDPLVALDVCLLLTRDGVWSVGCGIGGVDRPLPRDVRSGSGPAFVAARRAVDLAKKSVTRCAVRVATDYPHGDDVGPLLDLLLSLRARRSTEGWQVYDLQAFTQREMARRLGISEQAVSARVRAAELRIEQLARPALARRFGEADRWLPEATGDER